MVISEVISENNAQFGLFFLAPTEILPERSQLHDLLHGLYKAFPLLDSQVVWGDTGLELHIFTTPKVYEPDYSDITVYSDPTAFIRHQLQHEHSVFQRGMLRIICARCGNNMRWGIWLHHLIADADFVQLLLSRVNAWLETGLWPEPDLHFIQQFWVLNHAMTSQHSYLSQYWRSQKNIFRALSSQQQREIQPESSPLTFTLPNSSRFFTHIALALAHALDTLGFSGPYLAVTPVTLRPKMGQNISSGCYINLIPVLLDANLDVNTFDAQRLSWLEHALLPQEGIAEQCGVDYKQALVMINLIDIPLDTFGFQHHPEFRSRKPITLTLIRNQVEYWQGNLVTLWGKTFGQALLVAFMEALTL
ncbi:hypothetical protein [Xenorhabdus sp. PR6a]|uniref:hypothetical protein n=1 Tax=Xenorhabdus sp. PR6a TaxID=3025877 RepID=UPI002358D8D4|nr:hypothetical protein [Xenorhabdus sp. PR6a]